MCPFVCVVPPEVVAIETDDPVTAFRDRNVSLDFVINRASPLVIPDNIVWTFKGATLPSDSNRYEFFNNRTSLKIIGLTTADTGVYKLTATNPAGISSESINLDVQGSNSVNKCLHSTTSFIIVCT